MSDKFKLTMKFDPFDDGSRVRATVDCPQAYGNSITAMIRARDEMEILIALARAKEPALSARIDEGVDTLGDAIHDARMQHTPGCEVEFGEDVTGPMDEEITIQIPEGFYANATANDIPEGVPENREKPPEYVIENRWVRAIRAMQFEIGESCIAAGWYTDLNTNCPIKRNFGEVCMLMVTELAEAYEGYRKDMPDSHLPHRNSMEVEFADVIIRILDTCHAEDLDLAGALQEKFAYNQTRIDHSLAARRAKGGKKT